MKSVIGSIGIFLMTTMMTTSLLMPDDFGDEFNIARVGDADVVVPFSGHKLIVGPTGGGKSRMLALMSLEMILAGRPVSLIDTDGDTARLVFARLAEMDLPPSVMRKIIYLEPNENKLFRIDPFEIDWNSISEAAYDHWLSLKVESVGRAMGRTANITEYSEMPRRDRVLTDVLYLCGAKNEKGEHLGLGNFMKCLSTMGSKKWERLFNQYNVNLPQMIGADLWRLHTTNLTPRLREVESTIQWGFRFFKGPLIPQIFSKGPCLDMRSVVREGFCILAALDGLSPEQGRVMASILINEELDACWEVKRPRTLAIEEAEVILADDFGNCMARGRKRGVALILCVQNLGSLKK